MVQEFTHYYFVKVGVGNCALPFCYDRIGKNKSTFFYIGFDNDCIPTADIKNPFTRVNKDLYFCDFMSSTQYIDNVRLITFSKERIQIWKITGRLRYSNEMEYCDLQKYISDQKDKNHQSFSEHLKTKDKCKALDVRLEKEFPRNCLPACIDSLSVNRYLNQGTFRYLYSTNKEMNPDICKGFLQPEKVELGSLGCFQESSFAFFVRKYLDWLCNGENHLSFAETYNLEPEDVLDLVSSFMSPAQLETAASMFLLSLGVTLDVGIGKGLDVVDVRGSIRHRSNWEKAAKVINNDLEEIMGVKPKKEILKAVEDYGVISIQCKNYDYPSTSNESMSVVIFKPCGEPDERSITLGAVRKFMASRRDSRQFEVWHDWVELLKYNYLNDKMKLGFIKSVNS